MKKIVLLGIIFLLLFVIPVGCKSSAFAPEIGLSKGNTAPNFQLEDLNGNLVSLWDLRGKVVLLNFWTSYCGWCKKEMPSMEEIYQDYKDKGFEILAVNIKGDKDGLREFMNKNGFTFPVLLDSDGAAARTYQVQGVPNTYIIDSRGIIQEVVLGAVDWTDSAYRQMIEKLL